MKLKKLIFPVLAGITLFTISSCHKNNTNSPSGPKSMEDLVVPASFNWESTHEISLTIAADLPGTIGLLSRINIYDGNPLDKGVLLLNGSAGYNFPFVTPLRVPTALKQLYLELKGADGSSQVTAVNITDNIQYTFTHSGELKSSAGITEADCTSGCDVTVTGNSVTINGGKTYCISTPFSGSVNFEFWNGGGTLRICSTATISSINSLGGTNCSIIVTSGGTLNVANSFSMDGSSTLTVYPSAHAHFNGGINQNQATTQITNYSPDMTIGQSFSPNGIVLNTGILSVNGDYNINGNGNLTNSGTLNISGSLQTNNNMTNTGTVEVQQTVNLNGSSIVENDCKLIVHGTLNVNPSSFTMNNGYLKVYQGINLNSGTFKLMNQSQVTSQTMTLNSGIQGTGSRSTVKTTTSTINGAQVNGPVEFATQSGSISNGNASNFVNGATLVSWANMTNYIPTGNCNPEGSGSNPGLLDSDGDGVPNTLDDYPNDPTRAYNNYFPGKNQFASLAFEDLWPSKGDYDLNDLVLDCNYWYVTNAQNKVVDIKPRIYVRAGGATLKNAFGFQFDGVLPSAVQSVAITPSNCFQYSYINRAANGLENNQAKAVVIAFDNYENVIHRAGGSLYNTVNNGFYGLSDTVYINLHFATPQSQSDVGTPPYNPFLIKDMNRGIEIHMPDRVPTSLADPSYFGAADDNSIPATGRYYKTKTNLPWAIMTPVKFDYTWERVQIVYGHLNFGSWAESGGSQYPDWYLNLPGYRNAANIYIKP